MSTYNKTLHFFRRGFFITDNHTANQCTTVGWKGYRYMVTIIAKPVLDDQGFLIDHSHVHAAITDYIKVMPMLSCEETVSNIAEMVADLMVLNGCDMKRLGFEICPVDHNYLAIDPEDGELKPTDRTKTNHEKPASAECWIDF